MLTRRMAPKLQATPKADPLCHSRYRAVPALVLALITTLFASVAMAETTPSRSAASNATSSTQLDAATIDWAAYKGKVVLIDFWASWCGPCRLSFPWMQAMQRKYGKDGLVILAINVDRDPAQAANFLKAYSPNFEIRYDSQGKLATQFDVKGMPSTYLLGRDGQPAARHQGFFEQKQAVYEAELQRLLAKP